jgi:hypothetical protein
MVSGRRVVVEYQDGSIGTGEVEVKYGTEFVGGSIRPFPLVSVLVDNCRLTLADMEAMGMRLIG